MIKIYCCRVGNLIDNSHFDRTFHKPIIQNKYENIRWALNKASLHKNTIKKINKEINDGNKNYVVLFPNKPNDYPYAICELILIKERILGPLIAFDETNEDRGWVNGTSSGNDDFSYDLIFSKIYLLNEKSFGRIKLKGQKTFFELKIGFKNEELYKKILEEIKFIKIYVEPIICKIK